MTSNNQNFGGNPMSDEDAVQVTKTGLINLVWQAVNKFGLQTVALLCLVGAILWVGNKTIENYHKEQLEDKTYYRGEFKSVIEANTKVLDKVDQRLTEEKAEREITQKVIENNTQALKENTDEMREQKFRRDSVRSAGPQ